ncbi:MAG TPA: response regulator [Usitatibacter sp.]|nr:response regulator [Usitatibacter sp.]
MSAAPAVEDFKRIVDSLKVALALVDEKGSLLYANPAFAEAAGLDQAPLESLAEAFAEGDRKRITQAVARVAQRKAASGTVDVTLAGGRAIQLSLTSAAASRDKGNVVALLQDVTSQQDTENALNISAARLLALTEATPVATMIENVDGEIELANEAFCRLLGLELAPQSLTGVSAAETIGNAAGAEKLLHRQSIAMDEEPAGAMWLGRAAATEAAAAVKGVAEVALIEKIAMELSVAMEGIAAVSIRAQQMEVDSGLVQAFQRIRRSTETAMAAIGDLVDFSKLSGGVVLHKREFALREALGDLVARIVPDAEEHRCRLRIKVEQDVADSLEGDVERLQLVVKNLLDTAFALMPGSEVTLQITPEYVTESGIQLSFTVTASGAGQAANKAAAESGMGVAVAKFMVAAMGGKLAVASRTASDALYSFTLEFPVRPAAAAPRRATYVSLMGLAVLVVSGDPEQRLALSNRLRGWRMLPLEADNAPMAMALLERMQQENAPIPLVILSNDLPVQDGFLLAFRIKNHAKFRSTLVMMLATQGKPGDAIACRENGIAAYMRYPINDRQLNEAVIAVTGASVDADETPTLVTRHSLREQRKGATILLVDSQRDSQILAAHILGKHECSLVVALDLAEAVAALDQDVYDLVLVDTSLKGLAGDDAATLLRARITRNPEAARLVATSIDHSPAFHAAKTAIGFNDTLAKPFRKDTLTELLGAPAAAEAG